MPVTPGVYRTSNVITALIDSQEVVGIAQFSQVEIELNSADDDVYTAGNLFTDLGDYHSFSTGAYVGSGDETDPSTGLIVQQGPGVLTVTTNPEPSSFVLLGTGLLGVAGLVKRRFIQCAEGESHHH